MVLKNLEPLPLEEKKGLQKIVGNFFANFEDIEIFRIKNPIKTDEGYNASSNSWVQLNIPITSNEIVQSIMFRFDDQIRIGRLLEFLDLFAGYIGYLHCRLEQFQQKIVLVTACVDNVQFYSDLSTKKDIILKGYVTYVGKTSIEVKIDIYQLNGERNNENLIGTSKFLMVARDSKDHSKGVEVPKLQLDKEENYESCQYRYQLGDKNQKNRKLKYQQSFQTAQPNSVESKLLHSFFISPQNYLQHIPIQNTKIEDTQLMQYQVDLQFYYFFSQFDQIKERKSLISNILQQKNRNVHMKIFGGFLMRRLIESGWVCGFLHIKGAETPKMVYLSDIQFHYPVEIGSLVTFTSHVCYTHNNLMDVKIQASVINPLNKQLSKKTTEMHLILECKEIIPPVYPQQYEHGIQYLEGKRVLEQFQENL